MMREARELLGFACKLYSKQVAGNRVFMHEHPNTATSWDEAPIKALLKNIAFGEDSAAVCDSYHSHL